MKNVFLLLFFSLVGFSLFGQTNYYVSQQSGSDTNNGTSSTTPFKTIDKVINEVTKGDFVFKI